MSVNELKAKIELQQISIQSKQKRLAEMRQGIVDGLKPFIKDELKKNVESAVTDDPNHTKELGREMLSSMKQQLSELLEQSDGIVEETFCDDTFWIHTALSDTIKGYIYDDFADAMKEIRQGIKVILGEAGKLLKRFDYIQIGGIYQWENGSSFNLTKQDQQRRILYYGYVEFPKELRPLVEEYAKVVSSLRRMYIDISDLEKELAQQEAADLWNGI